MEKTKTEINLLEEISHKLDKLLILTAIQGQDEHTKIRMLEKAKFKTDEIGLLIGKTGNAIRMTKFHSKKK